jgi:hypothetical protein
MSSCEMKVFMFDGIEMGTDWMKLMSTRSTHEVF